MSQQSLKVAAEAMLRYLDDGPEYRKLIADLRVHYFKFDKKEFQENIYKELQTRTLILTQEDKAAVNTGALTLYKSLVRITNQIAQRRRSKQDVIQEYSGVIDFAFSIDDLANVQVNARYADKDSVFAKIKAIYRDALSKFFDDLQEYFKSTGLESKEEAERRGQSSGKKRVRRTSRGIRHKTSGKLVKRFGHFVQYGHEHDAGIAESLVRDAFSEVAGHVVAKNSDGTSLSQQQVMSDFQKLGVELDLIIRTDGKDSHTITLEGGLLNKLEGLTARKKMGKLREELREAATKLDRKIGLENLEGSDSSKTKIRKRVINRIAKELRKNPKLIVRTENTKENSRATSGKATKVGKAVKGTTLTSIGSTGSLVPKGTTRARSNVKKGIASQPLAIIQFLNARLPEQVRENMVSPALENRTGRFADSVRVTDIIQTPKGFPSVGYSYQRDPYQRFEIGTGKEPWATTSRDPRRLIDRSIRELAAELAMGRFFTRRT